MNLSLVETFQQVATGLLAFFGRSVVHTNSEDDEAEIQAIIESSAEPVGDYGERVELRWTATINKASGAVVGDTLTYAADDPTDDDVIWKLTQLIDDDGFVQKFALRRVVA